VADGLAWESPSHLCAVAYRSVASRRSTRVEVWPRRLAVGSELPTLPLWIDVDVCLPLPLEKTYEAACHALRITA
jgi:hypothetical protein